MKNRIRMKKFIFIILAACVSLSAASQTLQTNYFVKSSSDRNTLNPAFAPYHGYVSLLHTNLSIESNLSVDKFLYPMADGSLATFLHPDISAKNALSAFRKVNYLNADFGMDLFSIGSFSKSGNAFWTIELGLKYDMETSVPYGLFDFLKRGMHDSNTTYSISNISTRHEAMLHLSTAYSRNINDNLRVGGRLKLLASLARADVAVERMDIKMSDEEWRVRTKMSGRLAFAPMRLSVSGNNEFNMDWDMSSIAPAGYGAAIDLGAEYKFDGLLEGLNVSAAVTDLGFMYYSSSALSGIGSDKEVVYTGAENIDFTGSDIGSQFEEIGQMFQDMIVMENMPVDKSVTRMLSARFYIGAEYELLNDIMSVGLLYQGRFGVNRYYNELTASYNLRPCEWFALSLSYSFLNAYNTIGWALHLTPPAGLNFYIGSDYTFFKTAARPYVLPLKSTYANIEFGLSVPIQGFKMKKLRQQGN